MDTPTPETVDTQNVALQARVADLENKTARQRMYIDELTDKVDVQYDEGKKSMRDIQALYTKTMLPLIAAAHPNRMTCCFCMEELSAEDADLYLSPCGHVFHFGAWPSYREHGCQGVCGYMTEGAPCPLCRTPLPDLGI